MFGTIPVTTPKDVASWLWQIEQPSRSVSADSQKNTTMEGLLRQALLLDPPGTSLLGLELAVMYAPALIEQGPVGGDFFDAFALPGSENEVALLVGDMTGKGIDAAVHIAAVKFALRAFLRDKSSGDAASCPGAALARLSDFVCHAQNLDGWHPEVLASVALVILNTSTGQGRFALAAAEVPLVLPYPSRTTSRTAPSGPRDCLPPYGPPLGAFLGQQYEAGSLNLPPGGTLFLFTDGLTEARSPARTALGGITLLGYEGIAQLARKELVSHRPLSATGQRLLEEARTYAGGRLGDDACLLLARCTNAASGH